MAQAINKSDLAQQLGISRRTLYRYLAMHGAPQSLDVEEWRPFVQLVRVNVPAETIDAPVDGSDPGKNSESVRESYSDARARRTTALANLAEMQEAVTRRSLIPRSEIEETLIGIFNVARAKLLKLEGELPGLLLGRDEAEIQRIVREKVDDYMGSICLPAIYFEPVAEVNQ